MRPDRRTFLAAASALLLAPRAFGQSEDEADEAQKRRNTRKPAVDRLKDAFKLGETWDGRIEAVKDDYLKEKVKVGEREITVKTLVDEENADRDVIYAFIAKKLKTTVEAVAKRSGQRHYEAAAVGEWFRFEKDGWKKKPAPKPEGDGGS